jgi:cobalamin biosynthesis Mg chelatase CobN
VCGRGGGPERRLPAHDRPAGRRRTPGCVTRRTVLGNDVRAHVQADLAAHGDERRAATGIFGSRPGTYGAGLLQLTDSRDWRTGADLAEVYRVWGG